MGQLGDVQLFIELSRTVDSGGGLHHLMQDVTREMGFNHFALVHHVDLRPTNARPGQDVTGEFVTLSDYPEGWIEQYVRDDIVSHDPILMASQRTGVGFAWDEAPKLVKLTSRHREVLERTASAGLANGFTVPANIPGEVSGSCNFAIGSHRDIPRRNFPMAQLIGSFAFEAARTLVSRMRDVVEVEPIKLTQRQLDCLVLVGRGKSDWEIGKILGLSESTVTTYIKAARERYDVPSRIQVLVRALYEGSIPFTEIL